MRADRRLEALLLVEACSRRYLRPRLWAGAGQVLSEECRGPNAPPRPLRQSRLMHLQLLSYLNDFQGRRSTVTMAVEKSPFEVLSFDFLKLLFGGCAPSTGCK